MTTQALLFDPEPPRGHAGDVLTRDRRPRRTPPRHPDVPPYGGDRLEPAMLSARRGDPETSMLAASSLSGRIDGEVLGVFRAGFVGTDDELCARLPHLYGPSIKSARSRLARPVPDKAGKPGRGPLLEPTGEHRDSQRGRKQQVWRITHGA